MKYIYEDLMTIRKQREKLALYRIARAKNKLAVAKNDAKFCSDRIFKYSIWREKEENKLFARIKKKLSKINNINKYNQIIEELREKQKRIEESLYSAKQLVSESENNVKKAINAHTLCYQERIKLEEHRKNWLLNKKMIHQRKYGTEVDELYTMRFNRVV